LKRIASTRYHTKPWKHTHGEWKALKHPEILGETVFSRDRFGTREKI